MTTVEQYLEELGRALHTRGRARRRLLAEYRVRLADIAAVHGDVEAERRFGPAAEVAESFDTENAIRRAARATIATVVGVLAVGGSATALLNGADAQASAVVVWAVVFFASAQAAGVCMLLAVLRAAAMRHRPATPGDVVLLCRRDGAALAFSALALFAAGAAVPGNAAAWAILSGPAVAVLAAFWVMRVRSLARKLDSRPCRDVRAPLTDLLAILRPSDPRDRAAGHSPFIGLLLPSVAVATVAAFWWDHLDHGSFVSSLAVAGTEAALTVAGFVFLGPVLGLLSPRRVSEGRTAP
ncbi:MAG: hypothetical protein QOD35_803 [Nocardioidaceae bacterium]|nr:hypothetical protein [Nocardioidaceae bacterium]